MKIKNVVNLKELYYFEIIIILFFFFLSDRPTQPFEVEGDGKRNILLGWPYEKKMLNADWLIEVQLF